MQLAQIRRPGMLAIKFHKAWGKGVVVKVNGSGEDMELDIAFASQGVKRLLAAFAPIKKI